jgi:threonine aldolase
MAKAVVDDDVIGRDPTMAELEERTAALVGQEAGLFMVSGCMSNLVALMGWVGRGDRFLAPQHAHVLSHELGSACSIAGGIPFELPWTVAPGVPSPADLDALAAEEPQTHAYYELVTRLVCLENTHNHGGGTVIPPEVWAGLVGSAHGAGWAVHLDGARLWHAAAAQNLSPADAAAGADSVTVCLSKGLGAPVGSVLCSSAEFIARARRHRKILGGGIRQGGVLAAAGLVALEQELPRIDEDRVRARRLAAGLRDMGFGVGDVATNIMLVTPREGDGGAAKLAGAWRAAGVGCAIMGADIRLVTHRDITDALITEALERIAAA